MGDTKQILFSGVGKLPPREATFEKRKPGDRPLWLEPLEQAFFKLTETEEGKKLYGDPEKGATVEQAWRTAGLVTGKRPVCLLSTNQSPVVTDAIDRVIKMSSKELVAVLIDLFEMNEVKALPILYQDGHLGHAITLTKYNEESQRFTYLDPWPNYSLLCKDYNAAGVDAQPENGLWSITTDELERVIFTAFVSRPLWSEYMGEKYYITYDEFTSSNFWGFFHLKEVERRKLEDNSHTLVFLKTGGFQKEIDLCITVDQRNRLTEGYLCVKRSWIMGPPYGLNPFSLDIVRSFIAAITPAPDQKAISDLIKVLYQIQNPAYAEQLINEGPEKSNLHQALFTYLGISPSFEIVYPFFNLSMKNLTRDGKDLFQAQITMTDY